MSFSIQTNVNSLIAQENLRVNSEFQSRTINRLTSGFRINQSADDAAGLAVANKFRSDVMELSQGVRNANDGISALQIVDGGLNNISKIIDRLKTLATQSASATFTGNRSTLNTEYQALLTEINRQASNVGLVVGGAYNKDIQVYIGGGSSQSNAKVSVDLSGVADRVDSNSLGIGTTAIAGGGSTLSGNAINTLNSGTSSYLQSSGSQVFTFRFADNDTSFTLSTTVTGDADGISAAEALGQLNNSLSAYGITASANSSGYLVFGGTRAFSMTTDSASGSAIATDNGAGVNQGLYRAGDTAVDPTGDGTLTFTSSSGVKEVTVAAGDDFTSTVSKINAQTASIGIYAVVDEGGAGISVQSSSTYTWAQGGATTVTTNAASAPESSAAITSGAEAAITALSNAVTRLGAVQGKVGTGQNKLQYAIQLAQSQVAGFSAAESRIRDADVAAEAANLTKAQVLQQASLAAMAQANSAPQAVLALLRG